MGTYNIEWQLGIEAIGLRQCAIRQIGGLRAAASITAEDVLLIYLLLQVGAQGISPDDDGAGIDRLDGTLDTEPHVGNGTSSGALGVDGLAAALARHHLDELIGLGMLPVA